MSKTSSRDIKKRLFEFARNEFETKKPEYVEVRKAKGTKTFYRGPVPQLILTRYKAIAYTVFADFGTLCRLYYFNKDGYCIRDSSYSDHQLEKIKAHLKKTTTRVLRYPKIEVKPKIGNLSVKLDNRFVEIINEIEKIIKLKLSSRPVITLSKNLDLNREKLFDNINREDEFLELPFGIEETEFAEIVLIQSAFFEFAKLIFGKKTALAKNKALLLTLFFINDVKLLDVLSDYLNVTNIIPKDFKQQNRKKELPNVIEILTDYNNYLLSNDFVEYDFNSNQRFQDKFLYCLLSEFTIESDPKTRLANVLLREIPIINTEEKYEIAARLLIVATFLETFSRKGAISSNTLGIADSLTDDSKIVQFANKFVTDLYNFRIESFINYWRKNKNLFPESIEAKFDELTYTVFKKIIELKADFTTNTFDKPGDIIIKIKNKSDANLGTLVAEEIHWTPVEAMEIIGEKRKIRAKSLASSEEYTLTIPIIPKKDGTINFRNLMIRFNDPFGIKHFVSLEIPSLKIKKK
ncbi:MAG: hypothetical protein KAQ95_08660 [Candidatus Heimdallarchaeota archaeon]|nr:hypothetical protein [Candidatus Heimdallarchaeota archaeon]